MKIANFSICELPRGSQRSRPPWQGRRDPHCLSTQASIRPITGAFTDDRRLGTFRRTAPLNTSPALCYVRLQSSSISCCRWISLGITRNAPRSALTASVEAAVPASSPSFTVCPSATSNKRSDGCAIMRDGRPWNRKPSCLYAACGRIERNLRSHWGQVCVRYPQRRDTQDIARAR